MLLVAAIYVVSVLLLCGGFYFSGPLGTLQQAGRAAGMALSAMQDASLDELEKEEIVQGCAVDMLRQAVVLTVKLAVTLSVAAAPAWLAISVGWLDAGLFWGFVLRADVLLVTTVAVLAPVLAAWRLKKTGR